MVTASRYGFAICLTWGLSAPVVAQETLHVRIDRLMETSAMTSTAGTCSDAEFIRRASLDLVGMIPTAAEVRTFLDDPSPNKREVLVDRLLADPRYSLQMASSFNVMWMERRGDKHIPAAEWLKYLVDSFKSNKPYDQLVKEVLTADSANPATRTAAKFYLERDVDPHLLTRDIGRMFFGVDLQCAQCHDHPLIDDYVQTDYYGLYAFVSRVSLFQDQKDKNKGYIAEKADGIVEFKSVFTGTSGKTRPRLIGTFEVEEPRFRLGEEYTPSTIPNLPPVPKFSRRATLATAVGDGSNPAFRKNIVNRLWAKLMGRGLVQPVDLHHSDNPPSHPEVLDLLAEEIKVLQFQLKPMLRELALTKAYQRAIDVPAEVPAPANSAELLAGWKGEQDQATAANEASKAEFEKLMTQLTETVKGQVPLEEAVTKAEAAVVAARKPHDDATAALTKAQQAQAGKQAALAAVNEALAKSVEVTKVLPKDKEIEQAVAVFQARVKSITGEVEAATKAVTDQMAVVQAALAKLNEAHTAADAAHAQLAEARKPVDALKTQIVTVQNQQRAHNLMVQRLKKRASFLETLAGLPARKTAIASAEAAIAASQTEQTAANQAVEAQAAEVTRLTAAMTEAEKTRTVAVQQVDAAKATHAAKQVVTQTVGEAVAKTEAALAKLPDDADLKVALEKLKARQEPLTKELVELEKAVTARVAEEQTAASQLKAAQDAVTAANTELTKRKQTLAGKTAATAQAVERRTQEAAALSEAQTQVAANLTTALAVRDFKALSPEQLGWSTLQATGQVDAHRAAADAEVEKTVAKASVEADPVQKANRQFQVEQLTYDKLVGNVNIFITFYGAGAGQPQDDFFATPDQALFLANGGQVRSWIAAGSALHNRVNALTDPKLLAEEMYLSLLTRRPTEPEVAAVTNYLAGRPNDRPAAVQELLWALVASAEFRFQY